MFENICRKLGSRRRPIRNKDELEAPHLCLPFQVTRHGRKHFSALMGLSKFSHFPFVYSYKASFVETDALLKNLHDPCGSTMTTKGVVPRPFISSGERNF